MRDHLIRDLDATENMMIYLLEHRDAPGTSKAEVVLCNMIWRQCEGIYHLLKWAVKKLKEVEK